MKTRIDEYLDTDRSREVFGVSVCKGGRWTPVGDNTGPFIVDTVAEAEAKRADLRRRPSH